MNRTVWFHRNHLNTNGKLSESVLVYFDILLLERDGKHRPFLVNRVEKKNSATQANASPGRHAMAGDGMAREKRW
jgi:hypothetical protein